jgi:hypothetical protein
VAALALFNVPVALNLGYSPVGLHWANVELTFSNLAYPFLPYVYLLFVFLGVAAYAVKVVSADWLAARIKGKRFSEFLHRLSGLFRPSLDGGLDFLGGRFVLVLAVVVSAVVSCLFVVFTVLPWTNPTNMLVSVDSPGYYQWIVYMHSVNVNSALSFAFANDRALFLVLAYALSFFASPLVDCAVWRRFAVCFEAGLQFSCCVGFWCFACAFFFSVFGFDLLRLFCQHVSIDFDTCLRGFVF